MAYLGRRTSESYTRYEVVDDTLTTWKVIDKEAGVTVDAGLSRIEAEQLANRLIDATRPAEVSGHQGEHRGGTEESGPAAASEQN